MVIFIKKYIVILFRIIFCDLLKILIKISLKILEKLCHVNVLSLIKKNVIYKKKLKTLPSAFFLTRGMMFLDF